MSTPDGQRSSYDGMGRNSSKKYARGSGGKRNSFSLQALKSAALDHRKSSIASEDQDSTDGSPTINHNDLLLSHKKHIEFQQHMHRHIREMGEDANTRTKQLKEAGQDKSHHHHHKPPWILSIMSGIMCALLLFVLGNVFSFLIFSGPLEKYATMGVGLHTFSMFFCGLGTSLFAHHHKGFIAGVDINPTLFYAACMMIIKTELGEYDDGTAPTEAPAGDHRRRMFAPTGPSGPLHPKLLPTLLLCIATGSLMVSIGCYLLGKFHLTRIAQFLPTNVLHGFLTTIGFNILIEAISISTGIHLEFKKHPESIVQIFGSWKRWKLLMPAPVMGIPLYFLKQYHIFSPVVVVPFFLIVPLIIFYVVLYAIGSDWDSAHANDWFFKALNHSWFWEGWTEFYPNIHLIDWPSYLKCIPQLILMTIILIEDYLLKLAGTEHSLNIDLDFDEEFVLAGKVNFINIFGLGSPAYSQLELNSLNYGITHSTTDHRSAVICAIFQGLFFLAGLPIINFLPRFYLGGLVWYAGMSFLWPNLFLSYKKMTLKEYLSILIIVLIRFIFTIVEAVVVGICMASIIFTYQYSRRSEFKAVYNGKQYHSKLRRPAMHIRKLEHFGHMMQVIILKEALFFGSANKIETNIRKKFHDTDYLPHWKQLQYLILDFEHVTIVDSSAFGALKKVQWLCKKRNVTLLWSGLSKGEGRATNTRGRLQEYLDLEESLIFNDFDHAVEWVENCLLLYAEFIRSKWLILPSMKKLNALSSVMGVKGPFKKLFSKTSPIWKYSESCQKDKGEILEEKAGTVSNRLVILLHGKVSFYLEQPDDKEPGRRKRVACTTSGAILLEGVPCSETIEVDKRSEFIIFHRQDLERLKNDNPALSLLLHNDVLEDVFITRNEMGRALDTEATCHWDTYFTQMEILERQEIQFQNKLTQLIALGVRKQFTKNRNKQGHKKLHTVVQMTNAALHQRTKDRLEKKNDPLPDQPVQLTNQASSVRQHPQEPIIKLMTIKKMDVEDVASWFEENKISKAAEYCRKEEINGKTLNELEEEDFLEIGVLEEEMKRVLVQYDVLKNDGFAKKEYLSKLQIQESSKEGEEMRKKKETIKNIKAQHSLRYTLSRSQMTVYTEHFNAHTVDKKSILPLKHLRHVFLELGYYKTQDEMTALLEEERITHSRGINLNEFLHLMCEATMNDIDPGDVDLYSEVFQRYDEDGSGWLNAVKLRKLILEIVNIDLEQSDLNLLIEEWECTKQSHLSFEEFLSMIAYSLQCHDLEYQTTLAYHIFSHQNKEEEKITYRDIMDTIKKETGVDVDEYEAKEMIWEANLSRDPKNDDDELDEGKVSEVDFLRMITTMYDPGYIVHWKWHDRTVHRIMHELIKDDEFDQMDEVEISQEKEEDVLVAEELKTEKIETNSFGFFGLTRGPGGMGGSFRNSGKNEEKKEIEETRER